MSVGKPLKPASVGKPLSRRAVLGRLVSAPLRSRVVASQRGGYHPAGICHVPYPDNAFNKVKSAIAVGMCLGEASAEYDKLRGEDRAFMFIEPPPQTDNPYVLPFVQWYTAAYHMTGALSAEAALKHMREHHRTLYQRLAALQHFTAEESEQSERELELSEPEQVQ